jgi:streptogramin lyase
MNKKRVLPLCLALLACLAVLLGFAARARANLQAFEAPLNPLGRAYELNPDAVGRLWISESEAGEIWRVDPASGAYQVYPVGGSPFDAHHDAANQYLWWADGYENILGRVATGTGDYTLWQVSSATAFNGLTLDPAGRMWAMGFESPRLYRLDAAQGQLCTYLLPLSARAYYLVASGDYLWLGDTYNERLLRLTLSDNSLRSWTLPEFSSPFGLALDGDGNLWFADASNNVLGRLNPTTDQLAMYELPAGAFPQMITIYQDLIWYTALGSLGYLDPSLAASTAFSPTVENTTLPPDCASLAPSGNAISHTTPRVTFFSSAFLVTYVGSQPVFWTTSVTR